MPVLLVRHAVAEDRDEWSGDDALRPLNKRGRRQAAELAGLLLPYRPDRICSSPSLRCVQTVDPLAAAAALPVETLDVLAEGAGHLALELLRAGGSQTLVACSHGDVIPDLLDRLVAEDGVTLDSDRCAKGSVWVLEGHTGRYLPPPDR